MSPLMNFYCGNAIYQHCPITFLHRLHTSRQDTKSKKLIETSSVWEEKFPDISNGSIKKTKIISVFMMYFFDS